MSKRRFLFNKNTSTPPELDRKARLQDEIQEIQARLAELRKLDKEIKQIKIEYLALCKSKQVANQPISGSIIRQMLGNVC